MAVRACVVALLGIAALAAGAEEPAASDAAPDTGEASIDAAEERAADPADSDASSTDADAPPVVVPEPSEPPRDVEQLIIYANPAELLMVEDKTVSVVEFDFETIKAEGISDIRDLSNFTPSLQIKSAFAASNPTIFIRGVGLDDFNANSQTAVAIYQDDVYMQSPAGQLFQFFDVEDVGVLRGPQPTLYRNAEAGAILVRSKEPTDEFDGFMSFNYGSFDTIETEVAVGGPIVPERLLGRLSGTWGVRDGITENRCARLEDSCDLSQASPDGTLQYDPGMDTWTNDADAWALRGQLLLRAPSFTTDSDVELLANVHGGQNRSRALQYQHRGARFAPGFSEVPIEIGGRDQSGYEDTDGDVFAGDYNTDGPEDIDTFGANLKGTLPLGRGFEIHGVTGYEWNDSYTLENSDASPRYILESVYDDTAWQMSQDVSLRGVWDDLIASEISEGEWRIGVYYLQEDLEVLNNFDEALGTASHLDQEYKQETRNYSGYAYSEYRLRPDCFDTLFPCDFTLTTGLRYNSEKKNFDTSVCEQGRDPCDLNALDGSDSATWTGPGGEVGLAWDFDDSSNLYVKYTRGWKGGHFNGGAVSVFDIITGVDPEQVDSYEGGLRSFWFDDRLMLNVTGFYYDYQDLQVFVIEQTDGGFPIPKLVNAADSTVYGIEVDLGAQPLPDMNLTYNFSWLESEYENFVVSFTEKIRLPRPCRTCPFPDPPFAFVPREFVYTGSPLIGSPRYSMTGSIDYTLELPGRVFGRSLGSLTPRYSFSWRDDVFFDACSGRGQRCNFPEATFGQEAYWVHNATLTWRSQEEHIEVQGWVHNFLDEEYKTQNFDLTRGLGIILDTYADPRMFGVTVTYNF